MLIEMWGTAATSPVMLAIDRPWLVRSWAAALGGQPDQTWLGNRSRTCLQETTNKESAS